MIKFTPGPWIMEQLEGDGHLRLHITPEIGGRSVCTVWPRTSTSRGTSEIQEPDKANARLIAAAPEMYALMQKLAAELYVTSVDGFTPKPPMSEKAKAILWQEICGIIEKVEKS